jgi:ABC-type branched-subunit amino acid transport system ATPase component
MSAGPEPPSGAAPVLELDQLSLSFGGLRALSELNLRVSEREVVSVIGPNGAGKTTVFNVITGVYEPSAGDVRFAAQPGPAESIAGRPPQVIARLGVARTFQTLRLFMNMSVLENVMAATYGGTKAMPWESVLRLPRARREEREARALAEDVLPGTAGTSRPTRCPTRTGGGSRSPGRWPPSRSCCCWTSRPPG